MPKPKQKLDVSISRETSDRILRELGDCLSQAIEENPDNFSLRYLQDNYLLKYVDERTDPASIREHRAIVKWLSVERRNQRTNARLYESDPFFKGLDFGHQLLRKASRLIQKVIGKAPPDDLLSRGSFSGGASTSLRRDVGVLARKFTGVRDVTPQAWKRCEATFSSIEVWALMNEGLLRPRFVKGNVLFTVPKTALIDRVACKEPDYNIYCQKAVGDFIRSRLKKRARIDLNDQSINRTLAYEGSISGKLATIDLSSASDSLATSLVSLLLPREWFNLLDDLRSTKTFIKGASHTNEMFSSMGNGFTFELESLIFWALAQTVRTTSRTVGVISVFGDDIVVPASMAGMLIRFLSWVGFTTNVKKTLIRGPLRESCGGHYYRGLDVTPFYIRGRIKTLSDLVLFLNQMKAWMIRTESDALSGGWEGPNLFVRFWYAWSRRIPAKIKGGTDLSSRSQLCALGAGKFALVRDLRKHVKLEVELQNGLYLSRLSNDENPVSVDPYGFAEPAPPSELVSEQEWRYRKLEPLSWVFGLTIPMFLTEQYGWGSWATATAARASAH